MVILCSMVLQQTIKTWESFAYWTTTQTPVCSLHHTRLAYNNCINVNKTRISNSILGECKKEMHSSEISSFIIFQAPWAHILTIGTCPTIQTPPQSPKMTERCNPSSGGIQPWHENPLEKYTVNSSMSAL